LLLLLLFGEHTMSVEGEKSTKSSRKSNAEEEVDEDNG
jgi:hypothetical protein